MKVLNIMLNILVYAHTVEEAQSAVILLLESDVNQIHQISNGIVWMKDGTVFYCASPTSFLRGAWLWFDQIFIVGNFVALDTNALAPVLTETVFRSCVPDDYILQHVSFYED